MKVRNTITKFVTMAIAVAAIAFIGSTGMLGHPSGAHAQVVMGDGSVRFLSSSIGYVSGETLRFNVVNAHEILQGSGSVLAHVKVFDGQGNVLAQSEEVKLAAGQFHSFDFNRDAIAAAGDATTGRLQVRAEIVCKITNSPEPIAADKFLISIEVVDTRSGSNGSGDYLTGTVTVSADGF